MQKILKRFVLLASDENNPEGKKSEAEIAELFHVHLQTVHIIRKNYYEKGLEDTLGRKKRATPPVESKITGEVEAKVIALSCSAPPRPVAQGGPFACWLIKQWNYTTSTAFRTRRLDAFLKNELKPYLRKCWCIPPKQNAAFVACMEDILDLYHQPFDENCPVICMDEKPYQLLMKPVLQYP